ncbi:MAG: DUF1501 domain-containing protein, partial [Planctomycetaceae bacterium]|nr:DUF1501 domain-containing protein [Planctomycetaceae bacterium]
MSCFLNQASSPAMSRRAVLQTAGSGFGWLAAQVLLNRETAVAISDRKSVPAGPVSPQHSAKAKAVIQIFCPGGMSQVDTFDYKP